MSVLHFEMLNGICTNSVSLGIQQGIYHMHIISLFGACVNVNVRLYANTGAYIGLLSYI